MRLTKTDFGSIFRKFWLQSLRFGLLPLDTVKSTAYGLSERKELKGKGLPGIKEKIGPTIYS